MPPTQPATTKALIASLERIDVDKVNNLLALVNHHLTSDFQDNIEHLRGLTALKPALEQISASFERYFALPALNVVTKETAAAGSMNKSQSEVLDQKVDAAVALKSRDLLIRVERLEAEQEKAKAGKDAKVLGMRNDIQILYGKINVFQQWKTRLTIELSDRDHVICNLQVWRQEIEKWKAGLVLWKTEFAGWSTRMLIVVRSLINSAARSDPAFDGEEAVLEAWGECEIGNVP
ncbi:hypothetical protein LTR56_016282 [Elasticomyces elasticus]|nr:hypothetical protein LTR56_016282 [Elasticomyces elasticus]KAK3642844.1 hypothetical protein LTR22_015902 [Elasticomyces elasticus]KAK4920718.1 hypothetical protein LTR49_011794 [Elasticomyces elasticus]KAK5754132.1 hypothetical protein LTS12_015774 [Elasticomyces elasticus]